MKKIVLQNRYILSGCMLALLLPALLVGCVKRDLELRPEDYVVKIAPNWGSMEKPGLLNAAFYTLDGAFYKQYELPVDGGEVTLPKNSYQVLVYNSDAESVSFDLADHFTNATAYVNTPVSRGAVQNIACPGMLYSSTAQVSEGNTLLAPLMIAHSSKLIIKIDVQSEGEFTGISANLRNIADAIHLFTSTPYHSRTEAETFSQLRDKGVIGGLHVFEGITFGCCLEETCGEAENHEVYTDIVLEYADGSEKAFVADITEPVKKVQESDTEISIEIRVEDMGLGAVVTGWSIGQASGGIIQ